MKKRVLLFIITLSVSAAMLTGQPCKDDLTVTGPGAVCFGEDALITVANSQTGHSYQLRNNADDTNVGSPVSGDGSTITLTAPGMTAATTFNIFVTGTTPACTAELLTTVAVTINALPVASPSSTSPVCEGQALNLLGNPAGMTLYSWSGPDGFTSSLQDPVIEGMTSAKAGSYDLIVTDANNCVSLTVATVVVVNSSPAVITGTTSLCGTTTTDLNNATAGGTWSSSTPAVATVNPSTGLVTGVSPGTTIISYILPATGCSVSVVFTVYGSSIGGSVSGSATVCSGTNSTLLTLSGHTGNIVKWQYYTDAWYDIVNTSSAYLASNLTTTTKYRAEIQSGTCSPVNSAEATITVTPPSVGGTIAGSATVCSGTNNTSLTLSSHTGSVVKWQSSTDNWATSTDIANITANYNAVNLTATTKFRAVVQNGICPAVNSSDASVTVDPVSVGGTVAGTTTVCTGINSTTLTLSGNVGSVVKWESSIDNFSTAGTEITNNTSSLTATNLSTTTYYRAVVKSGVCSEANSSIAAITVDPLSAGGSIAAVPTAVCTGTNSSILTLSSYTGTILKWQFSTDNWTTSGDISNITASNNATNLTATTKYRAVVKNGVCPSINSGEATVTVNPLPVPTITGPSHPVRITSTGNVYTTESGMESNGPGYQWSVPTGGTITSGGASSDNTVTVTWSVIGAHTVSVNYTNGNGCTATSPTVYNVDVKPLPLATDVGITGTAEVGSLLVGSYTYTDGAGYDEGTSLCKWYRSGSTPSIASGKTYTLVSLDEGKTITFKVTPVSSSPDSPYNTGQTAVSAPTGLVSSSGAPVASDVCIQGIRKKNEILTGKYLYTYTNAEGTSTYQWYKNGSPIGGATGLTYQLQASDTLDNVSIVFEVTPVSETPNPKTGAAVKSYAFARFDMAADSYSAAIDSVELVADPPGGVFTGPGVTNGIFSPNAVGEGDYLSQYQVSIVNPSNTCSQRAYKWFEVTPAGTYFNIDKDSIICRDSDPFKITVKGIPVGAVPYYGYGFFFNWNPYTYYYYDYDLMEYKFYYYYGDGITDPAIVSYELGGGAPYADDNTTPWSVTIDPRQMNPGTGNNVIYLYYNYLGYYYLVEMPLNVESNETVTRIINLNPEYCWGDPDQEISVDISYPSGAEAAWTGGILTDTDKPVAKLKPITADKAGGIYPITYQYMSPKGCLSNLLKDTVTINPLPDPSFTLNDYYNIDSGAVALIPTLPPGGSFEGNGVSANKLFPDLAGTGLDVITYKLKDDKLCYNDSTQSTIIRKAQGTIEGLPSVVCYEDKTYTVTATGLPVGFTALSFRNKKNSIVYTPGPSNTTASYNILAAGSGVDTLIFSYLWDAVDYAITTVVNVDSIGQVTINNLSPDDIVCANLAPFELFASPSGGIFSGPVSGAYLDPSKALGLTSVSYTYTNIKSQCSVTTVVPFTIAPAPVVAFAPADFCIENSSDTTFFINNTVSSDPVVSWLWEFTDPAGSKTSTAKNPGNLYTTGSFHSVTLAATTVNNCTSTKVSTIDLGMRPTADFYWKNECFIANDSIMLFDTTYSFSTIVSRSWNFSDGGPLLYGKTAKYPKKETGYLPVTYIVNTGYANCADTITKNIYIRPTIALTSDNYYENFEAGNGDWVKGEETGNSWSFGKPDRNVINSAASGENAWYTNFDIANQKVESSSIISPCFDFSLSERPMIIIKLWRRFEKDRDGAALQYKIGDNSDWQYVGSLDDGINWYNSTLIKGRPGGDQIGWTTVGTPDTKWIESRHALDELKGQKSVKLRIAYGSDGTSTDNEGIAFDDIAIEERTRNVLLEHFANASSDASSEATYMIDEITADYDDDIVNVQYHTNFPGIDSFYLDNPGDASARILFYGLTKAPYSFVDGGTNKSFANIFDYSSTQPDGSLEEIDPNDITRRSLISPAFNINLGPTNVSGGVLTVGGTISAVQDLDMTNMKLYIAVIEKLDSSRTGAGGETRFYNIFRKFIPDAGGINLKTSWTKGDVFAIPEETWVIEETLNSSDIEVVAFIQNSVTKEMYQASSVLEPDIVVGIEKQLTPQQLDFALYPNPAKHQLTIRFGEPLESDTDIYIYDFNGALVRTFKTGSGETEFTIDDLGLRDGIYLIRISSGGVNFGFKKLIIAGS